MKKRYYHSLDMVLNQLLRPLFENLSSDPAPTKSRFYYNTTSNKVRFHNGSEWVFFIDSTDPRLSDRRDPKAHVLATESGLGPEHTISGASVGAVLRAISSSDAKFEKLSHSDLLDKGANSHSDIDAHLQDITKHFLINDSGTATNEVFSASKVLQLISAVAQTATGELTFMGGYDPVTNTPAILGGATVRKNHTYVITTAGNFYSTVVTPGDMIIAQQDGASSLPQWIVVSKDIPAIVDATTAQKGVVLIATDADVITGTDDAKAVTPKQLKAAIAGKTDNIIKVTKYFLSEIGAADFTGNTKDFLAAHVNTASITVDENTIQLFELTGDNLSGIDTVYREVYSLNNKGKGQLTGLTGDSFFMLSRDTVDYLNTIFALQSHTHASIDVEPDPRKVDKVTTLGDERVYVINADGTQGTKKVSDFSPENKLNKDFSTLPAAVLPLAGNETVAINQGGQPKTVSLSEIKSTSNFIPEEFIYTSGPQEFYTGYAIAQVLLVFVGGQKITDFTYTTTSFKVGATSAIVPGTTVSIVYIEQLAGANLFYTKAEVNGLVKKPRFEVCFKKLGDINREISLEPLGTRFLNARYTLKEMSIVFDEQAVDTNKAIPIVVSLISTNSGAPTPSVVYTALCNAATGQIYNKTYVFTMDLLLTPNTILAVTTGAFTEGAQVLKGCWVALTLEDE